MARLSCSIQLARVILFVLNIVFLFFGIALLGFGVYINVSSKLDIALTEHINANIIGSGALNALGATLIVVASFTILLSACGCLGAAFRNRLFLYLYAVILGLLVVAQLAALILSVVSINNVRDSYRSGLRETFIETYANNHTNLQHAMEDLEEEFQCCGVDNVTDYYRHNYTVPLSCYEHQDVDQPIYDLGCADAVSHWLAKQFPIIGGILGAVMLVELFGVIAAVAMGTAISHSNYAKLYD